MAKEFITIESDDIAFLQSILMTSLEMLNEDDSINAKIKTSPKMDDYIKSISEEPQ